MVEDVPHVKQELQAIISEGQKLYNSRYTKDFFSDFDACSDKYKSESESDEIFKVLDAAQNLRNDPGMTELNVMLNRSSYTRDHIKLLDTMILGDFTDQ